MDYGLAYRYSPEGVPKEYKEDPKRCHDGTIEFTSIDAHHGVCVYILTESFINEDRINDTCISSPTGQERAVFGCQEPESTSFAQVMLFSTAPSRRGDLEILGYCMIQWLCSRLPWEDKLQDPVYVRESKIRWV